MLVREAMTAPAVTISASATVRDAAAVLLEHRIASAPVLDSGGAIVGVVSEADLLRGRTESDPRAHLRPPTDVSTPAPPTMLSAVMVTPVLTIAPDADTEQAARLLLDHGIKMLPVVDGARVVGVLARRDLLRALARSDRDVHRDVVALIDELGQGEDWQVAVRDGVVTLHGPSDRRQRAVALVARTVPGVVRVVRTSGCVPLSPIG